MSERKNPILLGEVTYVLIDDDEKNLPNVVFAYANRCSACAEEFEVKDVKEGVEFAVTDIVLHTNGDADSQRTSIVVPYSEIPQLIKSLMERLDNDSDLYYLQESRSFNGNYMMFWGLEDKGYTSDIRKAQTYSLEDAEKRASNRETDIPRKVSDIKPLARHCFDGQDLRKIKQVNV